MKKTLLLTAFISAFCFNGCGTTQNTAAADPATAAQKVSDAYTQAVTARDNIKEAKEQAKAAKENSSSDSDASDSLKQTVKDSINEQTKKAKEEVDSWKEVFE